MWYKVGMKQVGMNSQILYYILARYADNELLLLDVKGLRECESFDWHRIDKTNVHRAIHEVLCGVLDE